MTSKEKRSLLTELLDDDAKKDIAVIAAFDEDEIGSWMTTNCIVILRKSDRKAGYEQSGRTGS